MMQESPSEDSVHSNPMISTIKILHRRLDSITKYLEPLMPLANCHMVEFFTEKHWETLLPCALRNTLNQWEMGTALERFWESAKGCDGSTTELNKWIHEARSHFITVNDDYCLSREQLQDRIKSWGGEIQPEIQVKEFMTRKKSYEVQTMSRLVASIHYSRSCSCCVEAGGGRGHLPAALSLGYRVPSLTVDCDDKTLAAAVERVQIIQRQWHAIAKRVDKHEEKFIMETAKKILHRFATVFITEQTDLSAIVKDKFPEHDGESRLLLTGLHTCGNLGPDSLRLFNAHPYIAGVFNVPCCYHLLTENIDANLFDVFQRNYGNEDRGKSEGFPMSQYMKGYNLGRNARMLAAQSIDRVVHERQLPNKSLLYRALLQVLIKKHLPKITITEGKLKRISSKCQNFEQYVEMAGAILNLDFFDSLPDSCLTDIQKDMDRMWKELVLFYLLRLCLAQVVESVILLDRLLYLFENGFDKVYLVKLFDPVSSPRCHGIVAVR